MVREDNMISVRGRYAIYVAVRRGSKRNGVGGVGNMKIRVLGTRMHDKEPICLSELVDDRIYNTEYHTSKYDFEVQYWYCCCTAVVAPFSSSLRSMIVIPGIRFDCRKYRTYRYLPSTSALTHVIFYSHNINFVYACTPYRGIVGEVFGHKATRLSLDKQKRNLLCMNLILVSMTGVGLW